MHAIVVIKDLFCAHAGCVGSKNHASGCMFQGLFYIGLLKILVKSRHLPGAQLGSEIVARHLLSAQGWKNSFYSFEINLTERRSVTSTYFLII